VVADYGADQTGNRDSTLAFNLALNKGKRPFKAVLTANELPS
jgi:hypothetical protein